MELTISTPRLAAARILPRTPRAFYRTAINAFFFVMGMVFASWAVRIPDIKAALQMSDAALGSVLLAAPLGEMLSIAPTAWLIGRFRSRRVIMLGLMLMPCALLSLALAGSPHWLAAALLGFGFANNMLNISLNAQAVGVETLYGRSIMATFHGMWSLGGVAGCIIGSIVAPLGVAPLPHFAAILVITLATLCCLRTWTMPREVRIGAAAPESGKRSFRPDLYLTLLGCIALGSMATEGAMYDWSSVYFAQVVQPGESLIRAGYLACMCAMVTGRLLADGLVNRFGVTPVLQLSGLCIAAGLSLALLWPDLLPATAGLALVGFGMASVVPLCYSLAGKSTRVPPSVLSRWSRPSVSWAFWAARPWWASFPTSSICAGPCRPSWWWAWPSSAWRRWSGASRPRKGPCPAGGSPLSGEKGAPPSAQHQAQKNGSPSREMAQTQFRLP